DELSNVYDVTQIDISGEDTVLSATTSALVVAGPTEEFPDAQRSKIVDYYEDGGAVMFLLDGVLVNDNVMVANANDASLADFMPTFGVDLNQDIVFDTRSRQMVNVQTQDGPVVAPYRFWPIVLADPETNTTLTKEV